MIMKIDPKSIFLTTLTIALATGAARVPTEAADNPVSAEAEREQPNIIMIFVDDMGYADIGIIGADPDVRTPNLDQLARDGVLFTMGYATAPQCIPSRAGLIAGRHQNRFGLEDNHGGPMPLDEYTIAERLRDAGYATGMTGKWHLDLLHGGLRADGTREPNRLVEEHFPHGFGFEEYWYGSMNQFHASHDFQGNPLPNPPARIHNPLYRVDAQTQAALTFLDRRREDTRPFFLYLAWFAPHSPLEEPPHYMERMSHVQERTRQMGLASILAMDDGLGAIRRRLEDMGVADNTMIIFMSDNGAPLRAGAYVGSHNDPTIGEKGMQTDGGQRIPYILAWPGKVPGGQVFELPVSTLDATATSVAAARAPLDDRIEGVNLLPWLLGERDGPVHDSLAWRWRTQAAILSGDGQWKYIQVGTDRRYLFDMTEIGRQTADFNKIDQYPEVAQRLLNELKAIADTWDPTGLPSRTNRADEFFYDVHVDRTQDLPPTATRQTGAFIPWDVNRPTPSMAEIERGWVPPQQAAQSRLPVYPEDELQGWFPRQANGFRLPGGGLRVIPTRVASAFLAGRQLDSMQPPVQVVIEARSGSATELSMSWQHPTRTPVEFVNNPPASVALPASDDWQRVSMEMNPDFEIQFLRLHLAEGSNTPVDFRSLIFTDANGNRQEFRF